MDLDAVLHGDDQILGLVPPDLVVTEQFVPLTPAGCLKPIPVEGIYNWARGVPPSPEAFERLAATAQVIVAALTGLALVPGTELLVLLSFDVTPRLLGIIDAGTLILED